MTDFLPLPLVDELLPLLPRFSTGEYGIALGGAHAKGVADRESDVDVYLFTRQPRSGDERTRLARQFSPEIDRVTVWGADEPFEQGGTDFYVRGQKVECWLRHIDRIAAVIAECQAGVVRQDLVTWTVMGYYNHCALSDLSHMVVVDDPAGILAGWQAAVREYPPRLRAAIIARHLKAATFWPENFHYASAVTRGDVIYVSGIVQQVIHNLIQVLFTVNRTYFPGDKKLAAALDHLAAAPPDFSARVERLLLIDSSDPAALLAQRDDLRQLVREVEALVD